MPHPCPACGSPVEQRHDLGRPRVYCRDACRAAASRVRRAEAEAVRAERTAAEIERAVVLLAAIRSAAVMTPAD